MWFGGNCVFCVTMGIALVWCCRRLRRWSPEPQNVIVFPVNEEKEHLEDILSKKKGAFPIFLTLLHHLTIVVWIHRTTWGVSTNP